jgi:hypothetical protein
MYGGAWGHQGIAPGDLSTVPAEIFQVPPVRWQVAWTPDPLTRGYHGFSKVVVYLLFRVKFLWVYDPLGGCEFPGNWGKAEPPPSPSHMQ